MPAPDFGYLRVELRAGQNAKIPRLGSYVKLSDRRQIYPVRCAPWLLVQFLDRMSVQMKFVSHVLDVRRMAAPVCNKAKALGPARVVRKKVEPLAFRFPPIPANRFDNDIIVDGTTRPSQPVMPVLDRD